ncbi:MAG: BlaI/MecI/CopY family transcriptional regulator [Eubacteriales bacterium]|nr:BlaI/MecI/CopY family transcriptional regulator [Eubacteriales bacterium]
MDIKLFDSERKVMDVLWKAGDLPARRIAEVLTHECGWNVNTTYTLIKRCIKKGAISRSEPNFRCHALITKEAVQKAETDEFIDKIYDGSVNQLFSALLGRKKLSAEQIEKLKQIVGDLE